MLVVESCAIRGTVCRPYAEAAGILGAVLAR